MKFSSVLKQKYVTRFRNTGCGGGQGLQLFGGGVSRFLCFVGCFLFFLKRRGFLFHLTTAALSIAHCWPGKISFGLGCSIQLAIPL